MLASIRNNQQYSNNTLLFDVKGTPQKGRYVFRPPKLIILNILCTMYGYSGEPCSLLFELTTIAIDKNLPF